jgi:hypothetical protein
LRRQRRQFSTLSLACLLATVALSGLGVASRWRAFVVSVQRHDDPPALPASASFRSPVWPMPLPTTWDALIVSRGDVMLVRRRSRMLWEAPGPNVSASVDPTFGPFGLTWERTTWPEAEWTISAPAWALALLPLALALLLHRRHRARLRREEANLCRVCGYDLRATPDRCPECGTTVG